MIEINVQGKQICVISGYGPQETWSLDKRMPFFGALEEEISKAELAGRSVMVCFDANSKMGPEYIPGDPHGISENGKIVEGIMERHALTVANGVKGKSKGVITRERTTGVSQEKSAIDLILLSADLVEDLEEILIDEEKLFALTSITKTKKGTEVKTSDHNSIVSKYRCKWNKQLKKHRIEHFNFKDIEGQKRYKDMTSRDILTSIVNKDEDVDILTKKLLKRLNGVIHESFKKIRIKEDNQDIIILKLFDQRRVLRTKTDENSKKLLSQINDKLAEKFADNNVKIIRDELKDIACDEGGFNVGRLWKLRKKTMSLQKGHSNCYARSSWEHSYFSRGHTKRSNESL